MAWLLQGISQIILSVGYKNQVIKDFIIDFWNGMRLSYTEMNRLELVVGC